ncbi:molecular chaperone HtpG [Arachidicoccus ginsenosidivorans]|uniref:Chaperone protein HtpG n=1 Tax=Arachidicoccus ginsenosidivorans TaxID=496057 RepID=A0A5B8VM95_9BACT|nr:molecular chaperone HtpG [Arachidicoccus ginsenosidivorans]QEC71716.1 molecular chaperone HtpG [Arachidicoccus ginsenosidivorans]
MEKGQIRVQTENIFPIIKKFLYSEHDIFLRELISNAVDASQKITTLSSIGEAKGELGELRIDVSIDKEAKTLTIEDRGVGMTAEEVDKYLNQVAFSGAEEFLQKYKDANIIGHFGLGFYSAFMVSDRVEVYTKSYQDAPATYWSCDGSPSFELGPTEKENRGTKIVLHINQDSEEFLEADNIRRILEKFCKFLPIAIFFEDKQINNTQPLWIKKPNELTDEDYKNFYKELYPFGEPPLFWIHLNVDYPFNLTGVLYFPKIKQSYEIQKDKIQLYSNQVFVTDEVKDIVPEFLMLLHGVIDSPDIPLNVSRSYLQGDPNVRKINGYITKKVSDKLEEIFKSDRKSFEEKWESIGLFVKYGMMTEDKFLEKAAKYFIMQDSVDSSKFYTLDEYKTETEATQKNKEGKTVILYTSDPISQDAYVKAATAKGYKVVRFETIVDNAFVNNMEMKWSDVQFTRVDADIVDNLIDKSENNESVLSEDEKTALTDLFKLEVPGLNVNVEIKGLSADAAPVVATRPEFMRRMKDMGAMGGGMASFYATMPDEVTLTVNGNHPIYQQLLKLEDKTAKEKQTRNLADLALLSQGLLKGAGLTDFINRSVELMENK